MQVDSGNYIAGSAVGFNLAESGTHFYKKHFGYRYSSVCSESDDDDWLLFPAERYSWAPLPLQGLDVAIVGNGVVIGQGDAIDSKDAIIRINYPYSWRACPMNDGERITHWAGLGKNEVFAPEKFENPGGLTFKEDQTKRLLQAQNFHCISHHHVQAGFWRTTQSLGISDRLFIHPAAPLIFDIIEPSPFGDDNYLLSWITERQYLQSGYGGWYGWDTLFTGVRVALLAALSMPKSINIYGMNFYTDGVREPWDMHKIDINREVLYKTGHISRQLGINFEIVQNA